MTLNPLARQQAGRPAPRSETVRVTQFIGEWIKKIYEWLRSAQRLEPLEFSQILTRYAVGLVITLFVIMNPEHDGSSEVKLLLVAAWAVGFGLLAHLVLLPGQHIARRAVSICADAAALSLLIHYGGRAAAIFFPVYLWVVLGNGFRFGIGYMGGSMLANGVCFLIMAATTPYWQREWQFSTGLFLAMIAIPLYTSSLIRKLRLSMEQAKAASIAKTEFLSMISHELRTPLNAILGLAQVSRIEAASIKERQQAAFTEVAANRLKRMLDAILKFQAVENGSGEIRERDFDITEVLAEVEAILAPLAAQKRLNFSIKFRSGMPASMRSDPDIIQTLLINIATNAIKYTRAGFVRLELTLLRGDKVKLRVDVHDSGAGIGEELQPRVFDQFVRGAPAEMEDEGGVGLGLSLCRSLIELLHGDIGFRTEPRKGSTFWFELPVQEGFDHRAVCKAPAIAAFGLDERARTGIKKLAKVLTASELRSLEIRERSSDTEQDLIIIADDSGLTPEEREKLLHQVESRSVRRPLIAIAREELKEQGLLSRATAAVTQVDAISAELLSTVTAWELRHNYRSSRPEEAPRSAPATILIADDNKMNRQVTGRMLALDAHKVLEAETGEEALDLLLNEDIDLAVLDVNMPDQDGVEVCKIYRSVTSAEGAAEIIGLTADISEPTRLRCLEAGMAEVLTKPVSLDELRSAISRCLNSGHAGTALPASQDPPVLDQNRLRLLYHMFGTEAFEHDVFSTFERETAENINRLKSGISPDSLQEIRLVLHAIKSSAATIGAAQLAKHISDLEALADRAEPVFFQGIEQKLAAFVRSYKRFTKQHIAGNAAPTGPARPIGN